MSSFGEALVGAFNSTYGNVTRARLQNEQAATMRMERENQQRHQRTVEESQRRNNLLNPDGSTNDPGAAPPLQAPNPQSAVNPNAGQAPAAQPAAAAPAAQPAAQPAAAAPVAPPAAPPAPAVRPAPAAPAAPAPAAQPAPAVQAPQGGSPQGAVAQAAQQAQQDGAQAGAAPQPPIPREIVEEAAQIVDRRGDNPADAMIVAGAMAPPPQVGPGQPRAADLAPRLTSEIQEHRGGDARGPLTRANWNAYLRDVTLSAQRNLSPTQQAQALAAVDRIRVAGLQRFTGLAVAAAQAGDMEGAARALNGASNFNPDGFQDQFRAVNGGVEMVRRPEEGVRGQETRVTVGAQDLVRYATAMMDPSWSLNHFLNVARHEETVRANRTREGLQAAEIGERRAARGAAAGERRTAAQADSALARAWMAYSTARERGVTGEELDRLQSAYESAATAEGVTAAGVARVEGLERQRTAAADARLGRTRLSGAERTAYDTAAEEFRDANTQGRAVDAAAQRVLQSGVDIAQLNRGSDASTALRTALDIVRNPSQWTPVPGAPRGVVRNSAGVTFRMPEDFTRPRSSASAGPSSNPPAPTDRGTGRDASMVRPPGSPPSGAVRPPAVEPVRTIDPNARLPVGRPARETPASATTRTTPLETAAAEARRLGRRANIQSIADSYGVSADELRRQLQGAR